jgi:hypothetical protein
MAVSLARLDHHETFGNIVLEPPPCEEILNERSSYGQKFEDIKF